MSLRALLTVVVCLAGAACPARATSPQERAAALQTFLGTTDPDLQKYGNHYRDQVPHGLDGRYYNVFSIDSEASQAKIGCEKNNSVTFTAEPPYRFKLTQYVGQPDQVTTTYSSRHGNTFYVSTDLDQLTKRLNIPQDAANKSLMTNVLLSQGGTASVIRFSAGIVVIQLNYGPPQVYARCE